MIDYKKFTNECGIYCFKNNINGKCYVGLAVNLKKRLCSHFTAYKNPKNLRYAFYKAVSKYGIENFDLTIIEFVDINTVNVKKVLDDLEKKYIKEFNSLIPNGYNMTEGGDAGVLGLKMTDEQRELIKQGALRNAYKHTVTSICAYNFTTQETFANLTYKKASELSGVYYTNISRICSGHYYRKHCKGWTFALSEEVLLQNRSEVEKFLETNNLTADDLLACGRFVKNDPRFKKLKSQGKLGNKKGFIMSEEQKLKIAASNPNKRSVDQLDLQGNYIATFQSTRSASESVGADVSSIRKVCKRYPSRKTCKGFIWRYHDDNEYVK